MRGKADGKHGVPVQVRGDVINLIEIKSGELTECQISKDELIYTDDKKDSQALRGKV